MTKNPRSSEKVQRKIFFLFFCKAKISKMVDFWAQNYEFPGPRKKYFWAPRILGPELFFFWAPIFGQIQSKLFSWIFCPGGNLFPGYFSQSEFISWIFFPGRNYFLGIAIPESWEFDFKILGFLGPRTPENFLDYQACTGTSTFSSWLGRPGNFRKNPGL